MLDLPTTQLQLNHLKLGYRELCNHLCNVEIWYIKLPLLVDEGYKCIHNVDVNVIQV